MSTCWSCGENMTELEELRKELTTLKASQKQREREAVGAMLDVVYKYHTEHECLPLREEALQLWEKRKEGEQ